MKTKKSLVFGIIAVLIALAFAACGGSGGGDPTVTSVTVSAAASFVNKGGTLQFSAVVNGTNSPSQAVAWEIITTKKVGTTITGGLLTVANDEISPSYITVKATSTFDGTKSGTATVTVNDPNLSILSGDISISPAGSVTVGTQLTATYSGSETVVYQWIKDGKNVGSNSNKHTPYEPGDYTVMVSANGYNSKLSNAVTVTGTEVPIENRPVADRWWKWVDETATATLDYTVAADGVCTIIIGGTAQANDETDDYGQWKAVAGYSYTATANVAYEYKFEAWTQSGNRELNLEYYWDADIRVGLAKNISLTNERKTLTIKGGSIPKSGGQSLSFRGADQLGTFYVKVLSTTPYTPEFEYELISGGNNNDTYRLISGIGMSGAVNIPATHNGKAVTEIDQSAFENNYSITSVTIPASVKFIGQCAFWGCTNLTSVTFAAGSAIDSNYFDTEAFPGGSEGWGGEELKTAYLLNGAGTYTRTAGGSDWTKQP